MAQKKTTGLQLTVALACQCGQRRAKKKIGRNKDGRKGGFYERREHPSNTILRIAAQNNLRGTARERGQEKKNTGASKPTGERKRAKTLKNKGGE